MNDAESTPSPKRFCRILGMRNAPRSASAANELPRKCAIARSRTSPAMRLRKIPAATRKACRPTPAWAAGVAGASGLVGFVTVVLVPSSFLFINENAVARPAKYSLRQRSEPPLYWGHHNRRTEGKLSDAQVKCSGFVRNHRVFVPG